MQTQYLREPSEPGSSPWSRGGTGSTVSVMQIHDLIEMALANVDDRMVEPTAVEPAELSPYAVPGLAQILSELVGAIGAASACRIAASWEDDNYLITTSWSGPEMAIDVLDRMLQDVELPVAIASVARLARSRGIRVRFVPGPDAVTAQIEVPSSIVARPNPVDVSQLVTRDEVPFIPHELERRVPVPAGSSLDESESFLERVFAPLRRSRAISSDSSEGVVLQVRVPGERFTDVEDDSPSTVAAEAAVEIRSALSTFDRGRRSAELAG